MRRTLITAAIFLCVVQAGGPVGAGKTNTVTDDDTGAVTVGAYTGAVYTDGNGGGSGGPRCNWDRLSVGDFERLNGRTPPTPPADLIPDDELTEEELAERNRQRAAAAATERRRQAQPAFAQHQGRTNYIYGVRCPNTAGNIRFVPTDIDATDLIPGIEDIAHGRIELPIPNTSPPLEATGYVNLGMWLAIEPATVTPITAEAGPNTWITVTPQHTTITFDLGNTDTITCNDTGTPITNLDTLEQGPCGYTYRQSSPDDQPYTIDITTTWNLPYTSSNGPGLLAPFSRTLTVQHNVDEIQTLGTRN